MRLFLAARSVVFVILIPGTVAGYIPWRILAASHRSPRPSSDIVSLLAAGLVAAGWGVLLRCVWDFAAAGRGTLAPIDPPRRLVVRGPYRFTRNPMYNGVVLALLGEALLFRSGALLEYALAALAVFHLVVILYEEPALRSRFGDDYAAYAAAVPRWGWTRHGYGAPRHRPEPRPSARGAGRG